MAEDVPASAAPTGAPSPLENDTMTVSAQAAYFATATPVAVSTFHNRAPSRCNGIASSRVVSPISRRLSSDVTAPPTVLCVFSTSTSDARGAYLDGGRTARLMSAADTVRDVGVM